MRSMAQRCLVIPLSSNLTTLSAVLFTVLLSSCGGGNSSVADIAVDPTQVNSSENDASGEGTVEASLSELNNESTLNPEFENSLQARLITDLDDDQVSGWSCLAEDGTPFVYTFFDRNTVPGFNALLLGIRYDLTAPDGAPWEYRWASSGRQTVLLDNPDGTQSILSEIVFLNPGDYMQALTEDHGILYCQRQAGART